MSAYQKNFIKEAIIRIDFEKPIAELNDPIDGNLEAEIMKFFTLKEPIEAFNETIRIDQATGKTQLGGVRSDL